MESVIALSHLCNSSQPTSSVTERWQIEVGVSYLRVNSVTPHIPQFDVNPRVIWHPLGYLLAQSEFSTLKWLFEPWVGPSHSQLNRKVRYPIITVGQETLLWRKDKQNKWACEYEIDIRFLALKQTVYSKHWVYWMLGLWVAKFHHNVHAIHYMADVFLGEDKFSTVLLDSFMWGLYNGIAMKCNLTTSPKLKVKLTSKLGHAAAPLL